MTRLQCNLSNVDTIGAVSSVLSKEVSLLQRLLVYFQKAWQCVLVLLSTSEVHSSWQERLARSSYYVYQCYYNVQLWT